MSLDSGRKPEYLENPIIMEIFQCTLIPVSLEQTLKLFAVKFNISFDFQNSFIIIITKSLD